MAVAQKTVEAKEERWKKAIVKPLPHDFLRISINRDELEAADKQTAIAFYQQQTIPQYVAPNHIGRLSITCAQAKLARNYGITRMDPYVRIRLGHYIYETQTDPNGGKNPRWNRVIQSQLPVGVSSLSIEIYDECSFKMDELIAWCEIKILDTVLRGETHEEWYQLSGKQGEGLEGVIDVVLSFTTQSFSQYMYPTIPPTSMLMVPPVRPMPVFVAPHLQRVPPVLQITETDLRQVHEMFPNLDKEVVKSVFEASRGNKDVTINSLLQLNNN